MFDTTALDYRSKFFEFANARYHNDMFSLFAILRLVLKFLLHNEVKKVLQLFVSSKVFVIEIQSVVYIQILHV